MNNNITQAEKITENKWELVVHPPLRITYGRLWSQVKVKITYERPRKEEVVVKISGCLAFQVTGASLPHG